MIKGTADVVIMQLLVLFILSKVQNVFELSGGWMDMVITVLMVMIVINSSILIFLRIREGKWRE